jgi:hypothetical protein
MTAFLLTVAILEGLTALGYAWHLAERTMPARTPRVLLVNLIGSVAFMAWAIVLLVRG